jgi:hypothetical protein
VQEFGTYLQLGFGHIADLRAYDHILFVTALTIAYAPNEWRRLGVLVTAFTLGHSLTLALATLRVVTLPTKLVETAIPITIVLTAIAAIIGARHDRAVERAPMTARYLLAGAFGLIHGLGFSNYLRALLGGEESIVLPLFGFNLGLEIGQMLIVATVLALGIAAVKVARLERRDWVLIVSGAAAGIATIMTIDRATAT